jgi:threonine synthase
MIAIDGATQATTRGLAGQITATGVPIRVDRGELGDLRVRCMDCGTVSPGDAPISRCPVCGGLLDVVIDTSTALDRATFGTGLSPALARSGVWRYRALLPAIPEAAIVTRGEGNTPLYVDDRLAAFAGLKAGSFGVKHEGHNPTGSFKDRGMTVGVSHAVAVGARIVACASTGNTSASLASYAAAAGIPAMVLIPEGKISGGKLAQTIAYGARVVQIEGDFDIALRLLRELTASHDVYLTNSINPFRPEGQKTIMLELFEQLGWDVPDVITVPGGNLGNTAAFGKAIDEAHAVGLIARKPRLMTIQAAGASPFFRYFASDWRTYEPMHAETVASAIKIGDPASTPRARRTIEHTNGHVTMVTDEEILDAKALIDQVGIGCEPASAASLAGTRKLVAEGVIGPDETVVGILTGNLLKDTDAVMHYHLKDRADGSRQALANRPIRIDATIDALARLLDGVIAAGPVASEATGSA